MKLIFIGYLHGFGGAEKQLIMLANEMANKGHEVEVVSISKDNECYGIDKRIKRVFIKDRYTSLLRVVDRFFKLKKTIKNSKPDVIINYWFQSLYLTSFMSKKITKKIIYSERGDPGDSEYNGLLGIIRKFAFKRTDGFVFQTKVAMQYFNKTIQSKSIVIHNPIFLKEMNFYDNSIESNKIVTVGRLHNQKNQKFLIEVFNEFLKKHPDYTLEIYGDGELKKELEQLIASLKLSKSVKLMGTTDNVHKCILRSKMFVLTSEYEGMPNALIEAMALGIPCISSNYNPKDSVFEFINNGENGFVFEKGNKQELLYYMEKICNNSQIVDNISKESRKMLESHSAENIYSQWDNYIKKLVKGE